MYKKDYCSYDILHTDLLVFLYIHFLFYFHLLLFHFLIHKQNFRAYNAVMLEIQILFWISVLLFSNKNFTIFFLFFFACKFAYVSQYQIAQKWEKNKSRLEKFMIKTMRKKRIVIYSLDYCISLSFVYVEREKNDNEYLIL